MPEDIRPWYRQFWCWFVFAPLGLWVIAMAATAVVLSDHMDDLVVDDYAKVGLTYQQDLARDNKAAAIGVSGRLHVQRDTGEVTVVLRGLGQAPAHLRVLLAHPTRARRDLRAELSRDDTGLYRGKLTGPADGRRYVQIEPNDASWRLSAVLPSGRNDLTLRPQASNG